MTTNTTDNLMEENEMPTNRFEEAFIEALKIINKEVNNPEKMGEYLTQIQETIEKGVTGKPDKPTDNT